MFLFNVLTGMKGREERAKQFVETSGSAIMTEEDILEDDLLYDRVRTNDVKKGNCPACHFAVTHNIFSNLANNFFVCSAGSLLEAKLRRIPNENTNLTRPLNYART